jgi:hypothetical protein
MPVVSQNTLPYYQHDRTTYVPSARDGFMNWPLFLSGSALQPSFCSQRQPGSNRPQSQNKKCFVRSILLIETLMNH